MTDQPTQYEALSFELNRLRERRMAQRRRALRATAERRNGAAESSQQAESDPHGLDSSNQTP